jgi:NHL repeat
VTDGYANSRVHRFTPAESEHVLFWSEPGVGPGQFCLPHGVPVLDKDHVAVCDRETSEFRSSRSTATSPNNGSASGRWRSALPRR